MKQYLSPQFKNKKRTNDSIGGLDSQNSKMVLRQTMYPTNLEFKEKISGIYIDKYVKRDERGASVENHMYPKRNYPADLMHKAKLKQNNKLKKGNQLLLPPIDMSNQ